MFLSHLFYQWVVTLCEESGLRFRNGHELPKIGSGPYNYNIKDDSIYLVDLLSSAMLGINCYFKIENDKLTIGNFYEETLDKMFLNFIKVE